MADKQKQKGRQRRRLVSTPIRTYFVVGGTVRPAATDTRQVLSQGFCDYGRLWYGRRRRRGRQCCWRGAALVARRVDYNLFGCIRRAVAVVADYLVLLRQVDGNDSDAALVGLAGDRRLLRHNRILQY